MAEEPNQSDQNPDPEDALGRAEDAAGQAADDIAKSPAPSAAAAEALAAAMQAVNMVRNGVDAAAAGDAQPAVKTRSTPAPTPQAKPDAADAAPFRLRDLAASLSSNKKETLDLLSDVQLQVRIELGRTRMYVEDVLQLGDGAVVELDKLAGDPVDVFVNDRHVARGEVLVLNDSFCVRISEILDPGAERAG
jgi:flagellar motor switch protein FliN/FliY